MAGNKTDRQFTSLHDCTLKILKHDGIFGLYKGYFMSIFSIFLYRAAYFGFYDTGKVYLFKEESNFFLVWMFAQATTTIAGVITYPSDTIRRRLMMQSGRDDVLYANVSDCIRKIYREEGLSAFYKGQLTNIVRSFGASFLLVLYDKVQTHLNKSQE